MKPFVDIVELRHSLIDSNIDVEILQSLLQYVHDAKVVPLLSLELCDVIEGSIIVPDIDIEHVDDELVIHTERDGIDFSIENNDLIVDIDDDVASEEPEVTEPEYVRPDYDIYNELVYDYVLPIYKWGVLSELQTPLTFKTKEAGVIQLSDNGVASANINDTTFLMQYYRDKMDFYINRLKDYLRKKARLDGWVIDESLNYYEYFPLNI